MFLATLSACATADDAAISYGGAAASLSTHPSVRMVRERVVLTIGEKHVDADCTFSFKNEGPACTVRMGFPDEGEGAYETQYYEELAAAGDMGRPPRTFSSFTNFRSTVDGKPASVELVADKDRNVARSWRVKEVRFAAGQTRTVRDRYQIRVGMAATSTDGGYLSLTRYTLYTGASWKGSIGSAEVVVTFRRRTMPARLRAVPIGKLTSGSAFSYAKWDRVPKSNVYYSGFAFPSTSGSTLRFFRRSLEPTRKSDIALFFDFSR